MAISVLQTLFKERKCPFIFTFSLLFMCVLLILFTNSSQVSYFSSSDLQVSQNSTSLTVPHIGTNPTIHHLTKNFSNAKQQQPGVVFPVIQPSDAAFNKYTWNLCEGPQSVDYIPCLDNYQAIKKLKSRKRMQSRERHCPVLSPECLVPFPRGYKIPVHWPKSRDMVWYDNVPHPKLVEYKKDQNWVIKVNDYFVFPGGGTQFKDGVESYVRFITKNLPVITWGKQIRVVLDVGCGVASFGGFLLDKNVMTMSLAPKDEHEAQIQFALERGIPAFLGVIGTQQLTFPDNAYDLIHCARCRVHWHGDGGKPLMELNRVLRPGGFFVWSATPVYLADKEHLDVWKSMVALTESICWKIVSRTLESNGIGLVIFQKPISSSCYEERQENIPPLCDQSDPGNKSWYLPLRSCIPPLPITAKDRWPAPWPARLTSDPPTLSSDPDAKTSFQEDSKHWSEFVLDVYLDGLGIKWSDVRNVMDMNAGYGGFAAALIKQPVWVMNVVPTDEADTLPVIFDRGLIGTYHDWCESFNTYPRTYDLLHSSFLFGNLTKRCGMTVVGAEVDRIVRPGGWIIVQDSAEKINELSEVFQSLHWSISLAKDQILVGKKGFWRPQTVL